MKVLTFGSLNIDYVYKVEHMVQKGETISSLGLQVFSGGKGLNQSIALARAGAEVYHAGAIGEDGLFLIEQMKAAGVDISHVQIRSDVRSGNAIIQNDASGDNCIILYGGANQAITKAQVDEVLAGFEAGDYLVLQNEINELAYIVDQAAAKGMKIVLNPSPMNDKILGLDLAKISIFMLNEIEAGQILHAEAAADQKMGITAAQALRARYPQASVVLTMGSNGSVYVDQTQTIMQKVYKVDAVDTTAAGDTFTGYFIAGMIAGLTIQEAMDQASRASAIAVSRPGASPSIPTLGETKEFIF